MPGRVAGRIMASKDIHVPIPGISGGITTRDFAEGIRVKPLRWGDYPGLSRCARHNHINSWKEKRKAEKWVRGMAWERSALLLPALKRGKGSHESRTRAALKLGTAFSRQPVGKCEPHPTAKRNWILSITQVSRKQILPQGLQMETQNHHVTVLVYRVLNSGDLL